MQREIQLEGGEITILKALGTSGAPMLGQLLARKLKEMDQREFVETLDGLITQGYVVSNKVNLRHLEEVEKAFFRANPSCGKALRDAVSGRKPEQGKERRRRRG